MNGVTYYFVVKSSTAAGTESDASNEIIYTAPGVNTPPSISAIADQVINEDSATPSIPFQLTDADSPMTWLTVSASSSNQGLVPNANVVLGGSDANRTVTVTPLANQFGTATITVSASDGFAVGSRTFLLTVTSINDAPTLNPIAGLSMATNSKPKVILLTGISSGAPNENQTLRITATHNNPAVLTGLSVNYNSPADSGSLTLTPSGTIGSTLVTVTLEDGGSANNTVTRTFTVVVLAPAAKHALYLEAESGVLIPPMIIASDANAAGGKAVSPTNSRERPYMK